MKVLFFDTETTDLNGYVIEISLLLADFNEKSKEIKPLDCLATAINPLIYVSPRVKAMFGINEEALKEFPTFDELWKAKAKKFFKTADLIVAHNIPFDLTVVRREFIRYKIGFLITHPKNYFEANCICTCNDTIPFFGQKLKLETLGRRLYISKQNAQSLFTEILNITNYDPSSIRTRNTRFHNAVYDTAYLYHSFTKLYKRYKKFEKLTLKRKQNPNILQVE